VARARAFRVEPGPCRMRSGQVELRGSQAAMPLCCLGLNGLSLWRRSRWLTGKEKTSGHLLLSIHRRTDLLTTQIWLIPHQIVPPLIFTQGLR
jgi:hypothetical protein